MEQPNVQAAVETAIRKLGLGEVPISASQQLVDDLGIDSTELAELAATIYAELGMHSQRISLARLNTVGDLIKRMETLLNAPATPSPSGAEPVASAR